MFAILVAAGLWHAENLANHPKLLDLPPVGQHTYTLNEPTVDGYTSFLTVTWDYASAGLAEEDFVQGCDNRCLGATHTKHEECNKFCDQACQKLQHEFVFDAEGIESRVGQFIRAVNQDGVKFGVKGDLTKFGSDVGKQVDFTMHDGRYKIAEKIRCWNTIACTRSDKGYVGKRVEVNATYQFYKVEPNVNGQPKTTQGPTQRIKLRAYEVPDKNDPLEDNFVVCFCAPNKLPEVKKIYQWTGGIYYGENPGSDPVSTSSLNNYKFEMTFDNMNSFSVKGTNMTSMPVTLYVWPGTECEPSDPTYQKMMTTEKVSLELKPWQTTTATVPVAPAISGLEAVAEGSGVCLNMHKKEPDSTVKYKPTTCPTTELRRLAKYAANERFKGPWTQTRFWIATDKATLDEVGKVMRPRPTEGMYLRSLHQASTVARLDIASDTYKRCLEPKLIVGATATRDGTFWFVDQMAKLDPKALSAWIDSNSEAFKPLFANDATEVEMGHAVDVANALVGSRNEQLRNSGLKFVLSVIPASHREVFVSAGGLEEVEGLLMNDDQILIAKALDTIESYQAKKSLLSLYNLSPKASPKLKERASKLAKALN